MKKEHLDPFVAHGTYSWSNACGYEIQISDDWKAARLRMPESGKVTDWLEIDIIEDEDWEDEDGGHLRTVIDPGHYNVPLDLVDVI